MKYNVSNKQNNSKMCFVCGIKNDLGLKASFFETETNELIAIFSPKDYHQSYPGRMHGGIASTILDETIGRAILMSDINVWGVTLELSVKFKKPVPLDEELKVVAKITSENTRFFEGEGEIKLKNGDTAVTAKGKYIKMSLDKITDMDFKEEEWFSIENKNDPKEIVI